MPKFYSAIAVRIGLHWPSVCTRVLIRKLKYLSKLLSSDQDTINTRIFNSVAMEDVYNCSIIQRSRMLEAHLGTSVLVMCLNDPSNAVQTVLHQKEKILQKDFSNLQLSAKGSANLAASIASKVSWRHLDLWDGGQGNKDCSKSLLRGMSSSIMFQMLSV